MEISSQQVCQDLLALLNRLKATVVDLAEKQGLTRVQVFALYCISQQQALGMGQIADALHCDASNVTGIVDRLVAQKLVVRKECAHDRRAKTLELTTKGKDAIAALKAALPDALGCKALTNEERVALRSITSKLSS